MVFVGVQLTNGLSERTQIVEALDVAGFDVVDLTDDETAKLHVRHMVGGRTSDVDDERLYRFQFPERPGAWPPS